MRKSSAFMKDIMRTIRHEHRRFAAIAVIVMLGVMMFSGLKASCEDLRVSADDFFDRQKLHDVEIISTAGFTEQDLKAVRKLDGTEKAVGKVSASVSAYASDPDVHKDADCRGLTVNMLTDGMDEPYLTDGRMPKEPDEAAVTEHFLEESGLEIGDSFYINDTYFFRNGKYRITGVVTDPRQMDNPSGSVAYRTTDEDADQAFVTESLVKRTYTAIDIRVSGADGLNTFSDEYEDKIKKYTDSRLDDGFVSKREKLTETLPWESDAVWYIQDRGSLSGFSDIKTDADSIEAIGTAFPIVFFIVAVLISLTTVARMIDEDRGLIGTYRSLGYYSGEIRKKYTWFFTLAWLAGTVPGTIFAFLGLPGFITTRVFTVMYLLPSYRYVFLPSWGIAGPLLFLAGITAVVVVTCRKELRQTPASLMRPKAPKPGARILLERVKSVWRRMSFLNKVTSRNIFRYKKRMLMTIAGVGGCMALLIFGFAIRDSVHMLTPEQYGSVTKYDLLAVGSSSDNRDIVSYAEKYEADGKVNNFINLEVSGVKIKYGGSEVDAQVFVVPENADLDKFMNFTSPDGKKLTLSDGDVLITENAGEVSGFSGGSKVTLQLDDLTSSKVRVTSLYRNYMGNYVFMTEKTFSSHFENVERNAVIMNFAGGTDEEAVADELKQKDEIRSVSSTYKIRKQANSSFKLINTIVYIVILMSAALAFTVLFTLSATNIAERERELATIKVLGFYDHEVHLYLNKETWLLTAIGILIGIPAGYFFSQTLRVILKLPAITLKVTIFPQSYLISALLCVAFGIIVTVVTDISLNKIDPVTALKSVE
ncbi:MAG: ABC transporter permease [Anaerovoracaceae bacterium]